MVEIEYREYRNKALLNAPSAWATLGTSLYRSTSVEGQFRCEIVTWAERPHS